MTPRPIACVDDGNVPAVTRPGETTMKMYLRALAVAAVLIVPTLAVADDTTLVQAFVPFEFTVGDHDPACRDVQDFPPVRRAGLARRRR
jgi:hypothetical protein